MKKKVIAGIAILAIGFTTCVYGWGIWGHNHINKGAVLALPPDMGMFFYNHADFITEESTVPDLRKYTLKDKSEGCRHYIDLERYEDVPAGNMPKTLNEAVNKYGWDTLERYGILPWYIEDMMTKLTDAFRSRHKTEILFLAADLGHYIADGHMPLHTTINHNGQLTGQEGIHAFWEAQLPELFGKDYNLYTGQAHYVKNIDKAVWDMVDSSYRMVFFLLYSESKMRKDNPLEKQYVLDANGQPKKNKFGQPIHVYEYAHVYHELLNGMVQKQLRASIQMTADFWYTAWVNAGKPNLNDLDPDYITERNKAFYKEDMKAWQRGKVRGCRSEKEF